MHEKQLLQQEGKPHTKDKGKPALRNPVKTVSAIRVLSTPPNTQETETHLEEQDPYHWG